MHSETLLKAGCPTEHLHAMSAALPTTDQVLQLLAWVQKYGPTLGASAWAAALELANVFKK